MGIGRPSLVGYQTISGRLHLVKALVSSIITATIWFFFFLFCLVQSPHVKSSMLLGSIRSMWRAMTSPAFDFQGDPAQQGGTLILGPGDLTLFVWKWQAIPYCHLCCCPCGLVRRTVLCCLCSSEPMEVSYLWQGQHKADSVL